MICPKCGCKECYEYDGNEYLERCANCGLIFDVWDALEAPENDDEEEI